MQDLARRWLMILGTAALVAVGGRIITAGLDPYTHNIFIQCGVFVILAVSLNLINGITGQFSIGHAGFYAIGAYVGAAWSVLWHPALAGSLPLPPMGTAAGDAANLLIAVLLAAVSAGTAGLLVGLPSLRLRGDYLAIVTLGFGEVIRVAILNIDAVGGPRGMHGIPLLTASNGMAGTWVLLFVVVSIVLSRNLMQSVRGLTWLAVREDEVAADAMGVNTTRVKVTAFVIGATLAGAAGAVYAHYFSSINPDVFGMDTSIIITTMVVLGGAGSVTGSVIAAVLLTWLPEGLRAYHLGDYRMTIYSTLLVVMMLTRPQGIFGHAEFGFANLARLLRRRRPTEASP